MNKTTFAALAAGLASSAAMAGVTTTVDFNTLVHGEIIGNQFDGDGIDLSFENFNRSFDIGAGFDTNLSGTADPDLESPWNGGGNLASTFDFGTVVIIAENDTDANNDGILDTPDDEANRPAGRIIADFDQALVAFGMDFVDIEGAILENSSLEFFLGGSLVGTVTFADLQVRDASVVYGNNSANTVNDITSGEIGSTFDRVVINVGGSSAYDNFRFTPVPTPGAVALMGLAGLTATRRRR